MRWWWWLCRWPAAPDELAVLVAFCQDTNEAGLAIECPTDVGWGDARVAPGGGDGCCVPLGVFLVTLVVVEFDVAAGDGVGGRP